MRKGIVLAGIVALMLGACAKDDDDAWLKKARAAVPLISGGFTFKIYAIVSPGDKEVLADEGVLYMSPRIFTEEEVRSVAESPQGKRRLVKDQVSADLNLLNTCFSILSRASDEASTSAGSYLALVLTGAGARKETGGVGFRLYSWPDAWYSWNITETNGNLVVTDSPGWGWASSRIVLTRDPSVTLETCENFRQDY